MALRYIDPYKSKIQPLNLQVLDTAIGRRQQRYDTAIQAQEATLQEALSRGYVDEKAREDYTNRARSKFEEVTAKYKGDLSAGYKDILGAVTDVRTDPYIQANQAQLEAYKQQQQKMTQLGQYGYLDEKDDISKIGLRDEAGNYRTTFQPRVSDVREFDKIGALAGTGFAKSLRGQERSTPGYIDNVYGFKSPEESANFIYNDPEGQEYITRAMKQSGIDPANEMMRKRVEQSFINNSIGGVRQVADRSLDLQLKQARLDNFKLKAGQANNASNADIINPRSTLGKKPVFMRSKSDRDFLETSTKTEAINKITDEQRTLQNLNKGKEVTINKIKEQDKNIERAEANREKWGDGTTDKMIVNYQKQAQELNITLKNQEDGINNLTTKGVIPFEEKSVSYTNVSDVPDEYKNIFSTLENIEGIGKENAGQYLKNTLKLSNELTQPNLYFQKDNKKKADLIKTLNTQVAVGQSKLYPVEFDEEEGYKKDDDAINYQSLEGGINEVSFSPYNGAIIVTDSKDNQYELDRTSLGQASNIARIAEEVTNFYKNPTELTKNIEGNIANLTNIKLENVANTQTQSLVPIVTIDIYDQEQGWVTKPVKYDEFLDYLGEQIFKQLTTK